MEAEENRLGSADGLAVSVGFGYGLRQRLALEFELDLWQLDYPVPADTPPIFLGSIDNLDVRALSGVFLVKGRFPFGRFRPYLAAGPGITFAKAELTGNLIGLPGTFADESDTAILLEALAGFDVRLTQRSRMGLEYRWVDADASFGDISDGSVAIGGQSVRLTYSHQFD
jgi:opacity protein-like surface antigen